MTEKDTAGVIAPPPLIFLSGVLPGILVTYFYPVVYLPSGLAVILAFVFLVAGLGIILSSLLRFKKANTKPEPWKPTTAIVANGIYRYTRNPMYVGMTLLYLGLTCLFNALWALLFLPVVLLLIHYGVILREEAYLERKFGAEYSDYKHKVRRWI